MQGEGQAEYGRHDKPHNGEQRKNPRLMNPLLVLAYIGDTVYDLYVRSWLIGAATLRLTAYHVMATRKVCAKAQAAGAMAIMEQRRTSCTYSSGGRNSHMGTVPKHTRKCRITGRLQALRRCWGTCFSPARTAAYASLWTIRDKAFTEDKEK